ncbi:AMP-binding protein [Salinicola tamaricis]|uniref:AMP-binding protein n=1 Tax=Salinicola tamaricis TaxID=1771309 RepID=UPI003BF4F2AF
MRAIRWGRSRPLLDRPAPGRCPLHISSPGWAKHAWSNVFAPWNAGCTIFVYRAARFSAAATLDVIARYGVTTLCAPPTVWRHLIQEDLASYRTRLRALVGAGEPLNPEVIERVRRAWNLEIRDGYGQTETTAQIGNPPGQPMRAGSMGRPLPGYRIALLDADGQERDEGEIAIRLDERPVGLMQEYRDDAARMRQVLDEATTARRCRPPRRRRLLLVHRPRRRRVQELRLPHQPVRAGVAADRA